MGSTLSTINILSAMASARITTDTPKAASYVSKITENSQRMMEAMDDIVWSIKPSNDSMQRIIARMREFATSLLESKEMDLHFVVEEEVHDVRLNMEARRDFFLIFKEAVNNAAKYSEACRVDVRIYRDGQRLHLEVIDNGVGFDPVTADGGNGLGNMQRRAAGMQAKYVLQSKVGAGTRIHLQLPL
jgi:signal transduction histidine kinase